MPLSGKSAAAMPAEASCRDIVFLKTDCRKHASRRPRKASGAKGWFVWRRRLRQMKRKRSAGRISTLGNTGQYAYAHAGATAAAANYDHCDNVPAFFSHAWVRKTPSGMA